jgi:hypothetical protein
MKFHDQRLASNFESHRETADAACFVSSDAKTAWFRRLRSEVLIEVALTAFCLIWALTWTTKLGIAISLLSLRCGLADFVTAMVVLKCDPDRWHGRALAALFIAWGFLRATLAAAIILGVSLIALLALQKAVPGNRMFPFLLTSFGTGLICVMAYLMLIFPFALVAFWISLRTRLRISFAAELTKLRLNGEHPQRTVRLDVLKSVSRMSLASGISLAAYFIVCASCLLAFRPQLGSPWIMLCSVTVPFAWGAVFFRTIQGPN